MAFHDVQLPTAVELGAVGGPRFKTTVISLRGGYEKRNIEWSQTRGEWDIGFGENLIEQRYAVRDFFMARQGQAHSFRFKDHGDYEIPDGGGSSPQEIGTGDGSNKTFQVVKRYASGGYTYEKTITKIVAGTYTVYVGGTPKAEPGDYSMDAATGIITFVVAPGSSVSVGIVCEFDHVVRFAMDEWDNEMFLPGYAGIPNVKIREVRVD